MNFSKPVSPIFKSSERIFNELEAQVDLKQLGSELDKKNMLGLLETFPAQMSEAWGLGETFSKSLPNGDYKRIIVCGMGGSAIGGDMVRSCLGERLRVPLFVSRSYQVPAYLLEKAVCIISSYSGNTGETLSSYESLRGKAASVLAITSGGELEDICMRDGLPICKIPGGMPPRAAIAYSFFPTLHVVGALGLGGIREEEFFEAREDINRLCADYSLNNPENRAVIAAKKLHNRFPFIYSAGLLCEAVARRWSCQINENGKSLAHFASFTELNHNEIVGWEKPEELLDKIAIVSLEDREDHELSKRQRDIYLGIVEPLSGCVLRIESAGKERMGRILSLMILGDFVSVYLAFLNGVDPTPVEKIDFLKKRLNQ